MGTTAATASPSALRKADLPNQKTPGVGFQNLRFAHKANAGDTIINLASLTVPTEMSAVGFTNPTQAQLVAANLASSKNSLLVWSSAKGPLMQDLSFRIISSTQILLSFAAVEGEIFSGTIFYSPITGVRVVDSSAQPLTGTLTAGSTDINIGNAFQTNKYPNGQIGAVELLLDGVSCLRNPGNSSSVVTGTYYEVDNGNGSFSILRVNQADPDRDRTWVVKPVGALVERPDGSQMAYIESIQGQLISMATLLAAAIGVPLATVLAATPSNVDLTAFANRVATLESTKASLAVVSSAASGLFPLSNSTLDDSTATRLGLKQYVHGGTYNGGLAPTITATNLVSTRGAFIPYQLQDGSWRLRFNLGINLSAGVTSVVTNVNGISMNTTYPNNQAIAASANAGNGLAYGVVSSSGSFVSGTATSSGLWCLSGDVELTGKPTWAY